MEPQIEYLYKHIDAETKCSPIGRRYFEMHFREGKYMYCDQYSIEMCS